MVMTHVPSEDWGVATGLAFLAFTIGGVAYGVRFLCLHHSIMLISFQVIDQVIVKNKLKEEAIKLIVPALYMAGIPLEKLPIALPAFLAGQVQNPVFASADPKGLYAAGEAMKEAWVNVLRFVYLVSILFGGVMFVLSIFQRSVATPSTSHVKLGPMLILAPSRRR